MTPIFKNGLKSSCGNYLPISPTSQICKVFELMIRSVVVSHLEKFNLIKGSQKMKKGHSDTGHYFIEEHFLIGPRKYHCHCTSYLSDYTSSVWSP